MLTEKQIIALYRLKQALGLRDGSCFGVTDPSRLRGGFDRLSLPLVKRWKIVFYEGYKFEADPEPCFFVAHHKREALRIVADILGIKGGKLTKENFRQAGAKAVFCGEEQIFPKPKQGKK